jgi:hypothetical protein
MENFTCTNCNSQDLEFVKYKMVNGIDVLRKQCYTCGYLLTLNYKRNYVNNYNLLNYVNENLRNNYYKGKIDKSIINQKKHQIKKIFFDYAFQHFNRSYNYYHNVYLNSKEWKEKRNLIMDFYNHKCNDCNSKATDIHHLTYENIFKEKFEDLIPLCRNCHNKRHTNYEFT